MRVALAALAVVGAIVADGQADAATTLAYGLHPSATLRVALSITLVSGSQGTTTLGTNQTTATTAIALSKFPQSLSTLIGAKSFSGAGAVAQLRFRNATSLANVASITISLGGVPQVIIASGAVTQSSGTAVALAAGATVTAAGINMAKTGNNVAAFIVFDVLTSPAAATGQSLNETWSLTIT